MGRGVVEDDDVLLFPVRFGDIHVVKKHGDLFHEGVHVIEASHEVVDEPACREERHEEMSWRKISLEVPASTGTTLSVGALVAGGGREGALIKVDDSVTICEDSGHGNRKVSPSDDIFAAVNVGGDGGGSSVGEIHLPVHDLPQLRPLDLQIMGLLESHGYSAGVDQG